MLGILLGAQDDRWSGGGIANNELGWAAQAAKCIAHDIWLTDARLCILCYLEHMLLTVADCHGDRYSGSSSVCPGVVCNKPQPGYNSAAEIFAC